jgi:hypothetical protein
VERFFTIPISGASCPAAFKGDTEFSGGLMGTVEAEAISFNSDTGTILKFGGTAAQLTAKIHFAAEDGTKLAWSPSSGKQCDE